MSNTAAATEYDISGIPYITHLSKQQERRQNVERVDRIGDFVKTYPVKVKATGEWGVSSL